MLKKNIAETVKDLVEQPLNNAGFSLWNVRYEKEGGDFVLLVEVDRPEGVDMDACSVANDIVEGIVDSADPIEGAYCLEVASAGMYRELLKPFHFDYAIEKKATVTVKLFKAVNGTKEVEGTIISADSQEVAVGDITLDRKNIAKITAVFE